MAAENRIADLTKALDEECSCPVCREEFQEPKMLPCSHTVCKKCLEGMVQSSHFSGLFCPLDYKQVEVPEGGIDALPTNTLIVRLLDLSPGKQAKKAVESALKTCKDRYEGLKKRAEDAAKLQAERAKQEIHEYTEKIFQKVKEDEGILCGELESVLEDQKRRSAVSNVLQEAKEHFHLVQEILSRDDTMEIESRKEEVTKQLKSLLDKADKIPSELSIRLEFAPNRDLLTKPKLGTIRVVRSESGLWPLYSSLCIARKSLSLVRTILARICFALRVVVCKILWLPATIFPGLLLQIDRKIMKTCKLKLRGLQEELTCNPEVSAKTMAKCCEHIMFLAVILSMATMTVYKKHRWTPTLEGFDALYLLLFALIFHLECMSLYVNGSSPRRLPHHIPRRAAARKIVVHMSVLTDVSLLVQGLNMSVLFEGQRCIPILPDDYLMVFIGYEIILILIFIPLTWFFKSNCISWNLRRMLLWQQYLPF